MGQFSGEVISLFSRAAAPQQAGIIAGQNPAEYNATDPLRLWVIQVGVIIGFTQVLALGLSRMRQPRVIAEVIAGVLLGPSVMGRIPNFTQRIFPQQSIPILTLTANIGLVFFLFLVGLELDTSSVRKNARKAMAISMVGLVIPLGLGAAVAVPLYRNFVNPNVSEGDFILFVSVAVGITAFPVLCRILTELRLLDTPVGVTALSAGVGNDVVGWILLALAVALVNSSSGLTALWVLLAATGYVLFLLFPGRWAFRWLVRKYGGIESGRPTTFIMSVTFMLVLISAFFTDIIGIHPIFGGFVAGLIIPHEGGFAIAIVEKLEDLISLILLPLYFALSGLNTNLGLLDNGKTWAYVVLICAVAFLSKFGGCFATAKLVGYSWRESGAIGTLMSCKGLVELIVLNVGFQAGILDTRLFSMFVLHALVLTFITTPLTLLWYPMKHRTRIAHTADGQEFIKAALPDASDDSTFEVEYKTNFAFVLDKVEHLPAAMTLTQLLQRPTPPPSDAGSSIIAVNEKEKAIKPVTPHVSALRLVELDQRTSAVLRSQEAASLAPADPLISVVRSSGRLHRVPVSGELAVVPTSEFSQRVSGFVREHAAHMVVLPWNLSLSAPALSAMSPGAVTPLDTHNPFEALFGVGAGSTLYSNFVRKVFAESPVDVALFVERVGMMTDVPLPGSDGHHLFLPFFGGVDDRLALELVVQLCVNPSVTATVVRISGGESNERPELDRLDTVQLEKIAAQANYVSNVEETVYAPHTTHARLASNTADGLIWGRYAQTPAASLPSYVHSALSRITFRESAASSPENALGVALSQLPAGEGVIAVVGRARRIANSPNREGHKKELRTLVAALGGGGVPGAATEQLSRTVGDVGAAFMVAPGPTKAYASAVLVVQATQDTTRDV